MDSYDIALDWALERGLMILPQITKKTLNGIAGLYATDQIDKGTLLASIPITSLLQTKNEAYPPNTSIAAKHIHSASKELLKGRKSDFQPIFGLFDTKEYLSANSVQYFTREEIAILGAASPTLAQQINKFTHSNIALTAALNNFDPSIDLDTYMHVALNYASRAMTDKGFVPILDCFNHNEIVGSGIEKKGNSLLLKAEKNYLPGEEIFVTYGALDIFQHAINYNYYDPKDAHYIPIKRFNFKKIPQSTAHTIQTTTNNTRFVQSKSGTTIHNANAFLSSNGPSSPFLEILTSMTADTYDVKSLLLQLLSHLDQQNNIQALTKKEFKGKLKRFYSALCKEKEIIAANRTWVKNNF